MSDELYICYTSSYFQLCQHVICAEIQGIAGTKALLDVKSFIKKNEITVKKARLTGYNGILKLLDALNAGRDELRETGDLLIAITPDGRVIPQSELKKTGLEDKNE